MHVGISAWMSYVMYRWLLIIGKNVHCHYLLQKSYNETEN